jgi:hypothetical protein
MMNPEKQLSDLLQEWTPNAEPGSGFNRSVWARIEAAESSGAMGLSFFSWLQRLAVPRIAATCVAVALFGGILVGGMQARSSEEERYLLSLKPFASVTHAH